MITVKKPFNFSIDSIEEIKEEEEEEHEVHIEREEKPVVDAQEKVSEDYHGGDESTQSLPNTPSPGQQENNNNDNQGASEGGQGEGEAMNNDSESASEAEGSNEGGQSSSANGEGEDQSGSNEGSGSSEQESQSTNNSSNNDDEVEGSEEDSESSSEPSDDAEENNEENSGEGSQSEDSSNSNNDSNNDAKEGSNNDEGSEDDDDGYSDEESDQQAHTAQYNTKQVVDLSDATNAMDTMIAVKYYQTMFYSFLERFSEEKTKVYDHTDFDTYNMKKLMFRFVEKKPLSAYRATREKDKVVLILDNSGSMDWWASNLYILAKIALQRNDVEIYIAPNGHIEEKLTSKDPIEVEHDETMRALIGRRIIYVGDFDGTNTPVELSFRNDVVWVCPETRYRKFSSHNWVDYTEDDFKGVFIRAWDLNEMFEGLRMITRFYRQSIDFHENTTYEDDYYYEEEGEEE